MSFRSVLVSLIFLCLARTLGAWTITQAGPSAVYVDTSDPSFVLQGTYAAFQISNDLGPDQPDVWVQMVSFGSPNLVLAPGEDGIVHLGPIGTGASKTAFFYVNGSATAAAQSVSITVYPVFPPAAPLASAGFSFSAVSEQIANVANTVTYISVTPAAALGEMLTMTVSGSTGTIGAAQMVAFTPASYFNWPAIGLRLENSGITLDSPNAGIFYDRLLIPAPLTTTASTTYSAVYQFRVMTTSPAPVTVSPVLYASSGGTIKHTNMTAFPSLNPAPILPGASYLSLSMVAEGNPQVYPGPGTVRVYLVNGGSGNAVLDKVAVTLTGTAGGASYAAGTSSFEGSGIPDPALAGNVLTWTSRFTVPAGSSRELSFQASYPAVAGPYDFQARAWVGSEQVDTTLSTADDSPAVASQALVMPTVTPTPSMTPSLTETFSATGTPSHSPTGTPSLTPSGSVTQSPTPTATASSTPSATWSRTTTETATSSVTSSFSPTVTSSHTPTGTPSLTPYDSATLSPTSTVTPSATASTTGTHTVTASETMTSSATSSFTPTTTFTEANSTTVTPSRTPSAALTASATPSAGPTTETPTPQPTPAVAPPAGMSVIVPSNKVVGQEQATVILKAEISGSATVEVFFQGRSIKQLWSGELQAGGGQVLKWDLKDEGGGTVSSGIYEVVLRDSSGRISRSYVAVLR